MEQLVQMQLSNGYERDDHSQYLILQTASLQVFKSKPEAIAQIEHKGQSALPKGLSADVAVAFDGAQDLSLPALATIAQQYSQIQPKKMLLGVDLSSAFYRKEDIKTLNLDPVTHQGATLVTGQEIKEYSRDLGGLRRGARLRWPINRIWKIGKPDPLTGEYTAMGTPIAQRTRKRRSAKPWSI